MISRYMNRFDFLFLMGVLLPFLCFLPSIVHLAFSDGLFMENLPPATVGDRQASLFTKVSPPVLTSDSNQKRFFEVRLYDAKTGNNITNVNYFITVTKGGNLLMRELFYSKSGPLKIEIIPRPTKETVVFGSTEPFLGGYMSDNDQVTVQGPILLEGGLYHFNIEIFGIDRPNNIFNTNDPKSVPKFDSYLSVGDVFKENLTYNKVVYNSTLISYYDKISGFNFDSPKLLASWAMPFDWNLSRINAVNIFVHEEFKVPKNFAQFSNTTSFNATVNGQPVLGRSLAIDPFTSDKALIIHYLLTKNDIVKLAQMKNVTDGSNDSMKFTLTPKGPESKQSSTDIITDTGGIRASLSWTPNPPIASSEATLTLKFSDALSDSSLKADVNYDFSIRTSDGKEMLRKDNQVALNGTSTQKLTFPATGQYQIEVHVKSLKYNGQPTPDTGRNGIARGFVVVPK